MTTKETARQAFDRNRTEALKMLAEIQAKVASAGNDPAIHWGHVGDMSEVVKNLRQAGHWAGVERLVEK